MVAIINGMKVLKAYDSMKKLGRIQYARRIKDNDAIMRNHFERSVGMVTEALPLLDRKLSLVILTLLFVIGVYSMKI